MRGNIENLQHVKSRILVGDEHKRKRKYASREFLKPPEDFSPIEFCMDTSIHGLHHIGQRKRHVLERLFWTIAFLGALAAAGYLIYAIWSGFLKSPIMTVFGAKQITLDKIPFPAVTICNVNKIRREKWDEYYSRYKNLWNRTEWNDTKMQKAVAALDDLDNICSTKTLLTRLAHRKDIKFEQSTEDSGMISEMDRIYREEHKKYSNHRKTLLDVSQRCKGMILFCMWLDKIITDCMDKLFEEVETEYGFCCTFNNIPLALLLKYHYDTKDRNDTRYDNERIEGWQEANVSPDNLLFTEQTKQRKYPFRQKYPGRASGLTVLLNPDLEQYTCTNTDSEGFAVRIHGSLDYPRMRDKGILIGTGSQVFINARPQITVSEGTIRKFQWDTRRCVFDDEKSLGYYTKYTVSNCHKECIANMTLERCGCVRYYQAQNYNESLLCGLTKYECVVNVRKNISSMGMSEGCKQCLPPCIGIKYNAEVTSLNTNINNMNKVFDAYYTNSTKPENVSILHVYMGMDFTYPRVRKEVYKVVDLISNTGALLGLCLGFSMLSLLELLYYFSIRLGFRCRKKYMKKRASPPSSTPQYYQNGFSKGYKIGNLLW